MSTGDGRIRARLAITIVSLSLLGITLASTVALWFASPQDKPEMARLIFAAVLPLLGTWVGTVLAFYFARENLQAATDNATQLFQRLQPQTPVRDVMVLRERMSSYNLATGEVASTVPLVQLYNRMTAAGVARIPILKDSGAVLYVVHKATIDSFAASVGTPQDPTTLTETMSDLLANVDLRNLVEAIEFVGPNAVVQEARKAMGSKVGCNDVFVTTSGKPSDPVIGWLTNTDLAATE